MNFLDFRSYLKVKIENKSFLKKKYKVVW
jgi:hypothetical protein